ncbi:MAG: hypothetical protein HY321_04585 [Armatimonadetes bacterium]|nr:hypothetical protein [Armatimonadota bacterium]
MNRVFRVAFVVAGFSRLNPATTNGGNAAFIERRDGPFRFLRTVGWVREDKRPKDATTVEEVAQMFRQQRRKSE